jgi:hypothetical protein
MKLEMRGKHKIVFPYVDSQIQIVYKLVSLNVPSKPHCEFKGLKIVNEGSNIITCKSTLPQIRQLNN